MGQAMSDEQLRPRSHEELASELAHKFADKCFSSLEIYSLKDVFRSLADQQDSIRYLKEDTIARFLEIPDVLGASPVVFQMVSYLGAFPFLRDAPAVLGLEQLVVVVVIMTERYKRVLAHGATDRTRLLFKSLAVFDRLAFGSAGDKKDASGDRGPSLETAEWPRSHVPGFAVDEAGYYVDDEGDGIGDGEDDDDDLVLAAFESLDIDKAVRKGDTAPVGAGQSAMIPADNFRKLVMLLLLVAPLGAQESLSMYSDRVVGKQLASLRATAEHILSAFLDVETAPGIRFAQFRRVVPVCFPFLFDGFNALFEHFLFSKTLDFSKATPKSNITVEVAVPSSAPTAVSQLKGPSTKVDAVELVQPLLQDSGEIMNLDMISQLSFFLPGTSLFRRLRLLYSGNEAGFSMGSFESKVFNWRAPTILLVRGTRLSSIPQGGQEASFAASLPPRRFRSGSKTDSDRLTFGVYIDQPWKHTHRECFGGPDTVLFQLEPVHDVFPASTLNNEYVTFTKPPGNAPCLAFGCPHPLPTKSQRRDAVLSLGSVSLLIDSSFEFAVFNHDFGHKGGAFANSVTRRFDFQDRFEIESLEVWGCGGDAEAKIQAERWAWEAREAEARRRINLGTGDLDADRALLEMAGLIGANRSGGSMA